MENGFIKLHRQMIKWEWYTDIPTKVLFIHLLFSANHEAQKWRGIEIKRGQLISSYKHLAEECGLSVQQVRTALKKLESTQEVTSQSTSQNTVITIKNYDKYQANNKQITNEQQTSNKRATTNKNEKNEKNEKNVLSFDTTGAPVNVVEKKKFDPYINPIKDFFIQEYRKTFDKKPFLSNQDHNRIVELAADYPDIRELIPIALKKLKDINWDMDYKPTASWLLKGNNFERVMNGEFDRQKSTREQQIERLLKNATENY